MATPRAKALESLPIFAGLSGKDRELLASNLDEVSYAPGITLIREGETNHAFFVLVQGGVAAVGVAGAARVLPGAIVAPWAAVVADRFPRPRVVAAIHAIWAIVLLTLLAATAAHLPLLAVWAVVAIASAITAPFRATVTSLPPELVDTPEELTAANAVFGTLE